MEIGGVIFVNSTDITQTGPHAMQCFRLASNDLQPRVSLIADDVNLDAGATWRVETFEDCCDVRQLIEALHNG